MTYLIRKVRNQEVWQVLGPDGSCRTKVNSKELAQKKIKIYVRKDEKMVPKVEVE